MRTKRNHAGTQTPGILWIPQRTTEKEGAGSAPQDAPPDDETIGARGMDLQARFAEDLQKALKNREAVRVSTLRLLISALRNKEIERKKTIGEGDVLEVIQTEAKSRLESIEQYRKGGRN